MIGTSYIPFPPWAIFFCFVPLWWSWLQAPSAKHIFKTGWLTQFLLTLIGFNWVSHTVHEFGHLPWWAALLALFLFASFCTLSIPLAGVAWHWYSKHFRLSYDAKIFALPVFASIAERLFPMIFDWHFGYTWLWARFPAYHLADIVGFMGLSTIGYFMNALVLLAIHKFKMGQPSWRYWAVAMPSVFVLLNLFGWWHSQGLATPDAKLNFLVVQANIGNEEKLMAEQGANFRASVIEKFQNVTAAGKTAASAENRQVDFAVWPETAFPDLITDQSLSGRYPQQLRTWLATQQLRLITGGYSMLPGSRQVTNSFFALSTTGEWAAPPYHKTKLLAFGEYFPGAEFYPKVREWFPEVGNMGRGPGPTVLSVDGHRIGAQICYEGLFDDIARNLANQGAQVIVNLTNDSWYGTWQEPYQHGYMTLARAVEVRRPLVRSTNTGISTVALASGEVLAQSPFNQEWHHLYEVPYVREPAATAFMTWGYWLLPIVLLFALALLPFWRRQL